MAKMKKYIFYLTIQFAIICLILNCSGKDNVTVYVAGYEKNGDVYFAKIWKNGRGENLSDGSPYAEANSIFISNNDVYVVGVQNERPIQWINGIEKKFTDSYFGSAQSILLSNTDVFIAGYQQGKDAPVRAKYWKNGKAVSPTGGFHANSIATLGKDVYVVGSAWPDFGSAWSESDSTLSLSSGFRLVAKMWKNGKGINLTDQKRHSEANSIYISGKDIYITGTEFTGRTFIAKVWKNGKATNLINDEFATIAKSIYVTGDDVYVAGFIWKEIGGNKIATYWKNDVAIPLSNEWYESEANSIFVLGNDVYVAGYEYDGKKMKAAYWKNGKAKYLTNGKYRAKANSIYVINNNER